MELALTLFCTFWLRFTKAVSQWQCKMDDDATTAACNNSPQQQGYNSGTLYTMMMPAMIWHQWTTMIYEYDASNKQWWHQRWTMPAINDNDAADDTTPILFKSTSIVMKATFILPFYILLKVLFMFILSCHLCWCVYSIYDDALVVLLLVVQKRNVKVTFKIFWFIIEDISLAHFSLLNNWIQQT